VGTDGSTVSQDQSQPADQEEQTNEQPPPEQPQPADEQVSQEDSDSQDQRQPADQEEQTNEQPPPEQPQPADQQVGQQDPEASQDQPEQTDQPQQTDESQPSDQPQAPDLEAIMVSQPDHSLLVGDQPQFTAIAVYSDGSTTDFTGEVIWECDSKILSIDINGLAVAQFLGNAIVTATDPESGISGTAKVNVASPDVPEICQEEDQSPSALKVVGQTVVNTDFSHELAHLVEKAGSKSLGHCIAAADLFVTMWELESYVSEVQHQEDVKRLCGELYEELNQAALAGSVNSFKAECSADHDGAGAWVGPMRMSQAEAEDDLTCHVNQSHKVE
jgi:hypothetical protein